jgi:N-hydroxyarylamine O-acetyltransferase
MDVDAYLTRIGAARPPAPTGAALGVLHRAHVRTVPFEDYDIHTGRQISLRLPDLHDKIVRQRRGGYCYELNGVFAALLRELGYAVTLVSAFSLDDDGPRGPDFDHLRLLVDAADGSWIADVGDGAHWTSPVPRRTGVYGAVQVHRDGDVWWSSERRRDGGWERGWAWTSRARVLADFADRHRFQQHDPASAFVGRRIAVLATPRGRISLRNGVFTEIDGEQRTDRPVTVAEEWALLADRFGIVLDRPWAEAVPQPVSC